MKKLLLIPFFFFIQIELNQSFASDQWIQMANFGGNARHRCTAFAVGNKGYIGGGHINSGQSFYHEDYWQYDPSSDSWTQIADFGGGKRYHSTAFTIGDFGYVGLGEDDQDIYHNDFYRYSPEFNIWQPISNFPGNPRRGASAFVLNGRGYVGTGQSDFGYEDDFYRYNPTTNSWLVMADFAGEARSAAVSFEYNGKGYLGTGHIFGDHTKDFYEYDPVSNTWTQKADVGPYFRQDATGFVLNGKGYIGTGNDVDATINYEDFWQYDFEADTWTQIGDFTGEGRRYMVSFVIGNRAYAGTGTDGTNLRDFWMFDPLLSIDQNTEIVNSTYPNPSTESIAFGIQSAENFTLEIYNLTGQIVFTEETISDGYQLQKNFIGSGVFIYKVTDRQARSQIGKIQFD